MSIHITKYFFRFTTYLNPYRNTYNIPVRVLFITVLHKLICYLYPYYFPYPPLSVFNYKYYYLH
nr:MAG TPA: hypothetical protein [Caudoviricetes sp.]